MEAAEGREGKAAPCEIPVCAGNGVGDSVNCEDSMMHCRKGGR